MNNFREVWKNMNSNGKNTNNINRYDLPTK